MKRIPSTKVLSVFSILILLFFTSCNNVFENTISQQQTTDSQEAADDNVVAAQITNSPLTIQINGNLNVEGALPSEFAKAAGRSAKPSIPDDSSYEYYVKATSADSEKLVREAKIPASEVTGSVQYTLQLEVRRTWSFKAGFRKLNTTDDILIDINTEAGSPITKSLSDDTTSQAVNFRLKPLQKGGKGSLDLKMKKVPDGITKLRLFNNGSEGTNEDWLPSSILEVNVDKDTDDNNYIRSVNGEYNIDSGTYNITMVFYMTYGTAPNQYDIPMYITYQTINVFDNLTTNVWVSNSTSDSNQIITSTDGFKLTSDLIQNFAENTIYVGCPEGLNVSTSDDYVGSAYAPLRTLTRAINTIQAKGNGNAYRILVSGEQSGNFLIPSGINTEKAASIEIKTTTGNAGRAVLNGAGTGSVLTVESAVPLTLSNIQLKNGKGDVEKGGGIMMIAGTTVTLESGTVIGDDSSSISNPADSAVNSSNCAKLGGGIYTLGNLTLKSGSKVCYNYSNGTETEQGGGGIFCIGGSVTLENGAIVSKNGSAGNGGAIYLKDGTLKMSGAASVQGESTNNEAGKNDVWLAAGKYITLTDSAEFSDLVEIRADWKRGKAVVKADNDTIVIKDQRIANKFSLFIPEGNGWQTRYYTDRISVNSPIYISDTGNNDNDGSENSPFPTIARAIDDMTEADADYEIFIDGTVTGIHSFPSTLKKEVSAGDANGTHYAQSILIKGKNGLYTSGEHQGEPQDVMDGNSEGSVITIESPVPITIEDLKITKGGNTNEGGGINMKAGTDVTINDGVLITDNTATTSGGGIFDRGGHLKINGGKISKNHLTRSSYANDLGGIGVFVGGSNSITKTIFEMTGGEISENEPGTNTNIDICGCGVKLRNGDGGTGGPVEFKMTGGKITKNKSLWKGANIFTDVAKIILSGDAEISYGEISATGSESAYGAGITLWGGAHLEMSGGKIFGNKASVTNTTKEACSGVMVPDGCSFTMTGGDIYDNEASGGATLGGALFVQGEFKMSGTAKIKYGVEDPDTHAVSKGKGKNDVCLFNNSNKTVILSDNLSSHTENDPVGINLEQWKRGALIIFADGVNVDSSLWKKFLLTQDDGDWTKYKKTVGTGANAKNYVAINADVYVTGDSDTTISGVTYKKGLTLAEGALGTKSKPFKNISDAVGVFEDSETQAIVTIVGTTSLVAQEIPSTFTTDNASSLILQGLSSESVGTIKRYETAPDTVASDGSALTINSEVPVTIKNLTITGGYNVNGGGINISAGTVILGDGALIQGNTATSYGGGVYVNSGASLFMYKSALIGESSNSAPNSETTCSNCAKSNGGGIYSKGKVYLGYTGYNGTEPVEATGNNKLTGGVIHNYVTNGQNGNGGGITNLNGTFKMASGNISYNGATGYGGAIWGAGTISGGTIEGNEAVKDGGAVYFTGTFTISSGTFIKNCSTGGNGGAICSGGAASTIEMTGGIIGDATDTSLRNTASLAGGAIYSAGNLKMKGSVRVPNCGGETLNDVFLASGKSITINGSFDNGNNDVATITPYVWTRSTVVLQASSPITAITSAIAEKFHVSDSDWEVLSHDSKGKINGTMYVSANKIVNADGYSAGGDSLSYYGTKKRPFASIQYAASKCWDSKTTKTVDFKIVVNGTLTGTQTISETLNSSVAYAKSITVEGMANYSAYTGNSKIDCNYSSPADDGSALIINTAVPVTLNKLDITGGKTNDGGGGIRIDNENSNVTITNSNIYGNYTAGTSSSTGGGGILLKNGSLCLGENTIVHSNRSKAYGGGICNYNGKVYICGGNKGAIIGYKKDINSRAQSTSVKANRAGIDHTGSANTFGNGGGLYSAGIANTCVYIGYTPPVTPGGDPVADSSFNGGFYYNYAVTSGGGMYYEGGYSGQELKMSKGTIQFNVAGNGGGGGIYAGGTTTIENCVISENSADNSSGGGIYSNGSLTINRGTIGRTEGVNDAAQFGPNLHSNSAKYGGGISMSGGTIGSNVTISYNYASETGGGISAGNTSDQTISGIIQFNGAEGAGGGISVSGKGSFDLSANMKTNKAYGSEGGAIYMSGDGRKVALKSGFNIEGLSSSVTKGTDDILVYYTYNTESLVQINPAKFTYISIDTALPVGSGNFIGIGLKTYSGDPYRAPNGVLIFTGSYLSQCATYFKTTDSGHQVLSSGVVK